MAQLHTATESTRNTDTKAEASYLRYKPEGAYSVELTEGITVHVWPRTRVNWETFKAEFPPYSIGIDGFVTGTPAFDFDGPYRNFNHHEGVDGDATRATCSQVHYALKRGLLERFSENGQPRMEIFIEDADQDVCLSLWLMKNYERVSGERSEPLVNRLLYIEDILDTSAGMYPQDPGSKIMRQNAWIFDPYVQARIEGTLFTMTGSELWNVIAAVDANITQYATLGEGGTKELDTHFEVLGGGDGWSMVKEYGFYARSAYRHQGIGAFVAVMDRDDGGYLYTIGKTSPYNPFPLKEVFEALNHHESEPCWGGSATIGGSRSGEGSNLKPDEVEQFINAFLARREYSLLEPLRIEHSGTSELTERSPLVPDDTDGSSKGSH